MNTLKQHLSRTSPFVVDHIRQLLHPFPEASPGTHYFRATPSTLSTREIQLFWKYHGHFQQEFVKAIIDSLPDNYNFISYDHLNNLITVEVTQ